MNHLCTVDVQRLRAFAWMGALTLFVPASGGCIRDPDCGVCDPNSLVLQSIAGINHRGRKVVLLNPTCEGDDCPPPLEKGTYFVNEVLPCPDTEEAKNSADRDEWCKLSPLVTQFGIEFVFNNLLDPQTIELARRSPDNPQLFEIYDWKPEILSIEGPVTRYNGDYIPGQAGEPDRIPRFVNLSCAAQVEGFDHEDLEDPATNPCNRLDGTTPVKMEPTAEIKSFRGNTTAFASACSAPAGQPNTCCDFCDWFLSTRIARYGLTGANTPVTGDELSLRERLPWAEEDERNPNLDTALRCSEAAELPDGFIADKYRTCAAFQIAVDRRDEENDWVYRWDCPPELSDEDLREQKHPCFVHKLPFYDLMRETHPDSRPTDADVEAGRYPRAEKLTAKCNVTSDCEDVHDLTGTECIGTHTDGNACLMDASAYAEGGAEAGACTAGYCRPQWFVDCRVDAETTGGDNSYCVDQRYTSDATAACKTSTVPFSGLCDDNQQGCMGEDTGTIAFCDGNQNGRVTAGECCQESLGGPAYPNTCDPFYQENVVSVAHYQRDQNLPPESRDCVCQPLETLDASNEYCARAIEVGCYGTNPDGESEYLTNRHGQFAVKFLARLGGIVYDPAAKGFAWFPADGGGVPRARIENCAEAARGDVIGERNVLDGWRAHDTAGREHSEDFDRAMCSGQEYTIEFVEPDDGAGLEDKVGNTLSGRSIYKFETPQFHIVAQSGFPQSPTRIGSCDRFSLDFSNRYDLSPENLKKLQIYRLDDDGEPTTPSDRCDRIVPVAGGPACIATGPEYQASTDECAAPCLTVDIATHGVGEIAVEIDTSQFGTILEAGVRYRLTAPSVSHFEDAVSNPEAYASVFWDACGMPLVRAGAEPYQYDFRIDPPSCSQDADRDDVPLSCDNARDFANNDQSDLDFDGVGDVIDLCVLVPSGGPNTADSDADAIGNECDTCRQRPDFYNESALLLGLRPNMYVRNIPHQTDTDDDGIGDACDNCVVTPNCQDYGPDNPYRLGDPVAFEDTAICQRDDDANMVGDSCDGQMINPFAAGPIGLGDDDDFDQDGVRNIADACPRQPLTDPAPILCTTDEECPPSRSCALDAAGDSGQCNHVDTDEDTVGDICDTCSELANQFQVLQGGTTEDDPDGDFVGSSCEADIRCADRERNARPYGYFPVSANGFCCIAALTEDPETGELTNQFTQDSLVAPHPEIPTEVIPVRRAEHCSLDQQQANECRALPPQLDTRPGIFVPPSGCEEAFAAHPDITDPAANLAARYNNENNPFASFDELNATLCLLPQFDQDFDGLGDTCDFCPLDFDPENQPYQDINGRLFPNEGRYCHGDYSLSNRCEDLEPMDTGTGGSGGSGGDPLPPMDTGGTGL